MREIRSHGSEGGGVELNRPFLPLSADPVGSVVGAGSASRRSIGPAGDVATPNARTGQHQRVLESRRPGPAAVVVRIARIDFASPTQGRDRRRGPRLCLVHSPPRRPAAAAHPQHLQGSDDDRRDRPARRAATVSRAPQARRRRCRRIRGLRGGAGLEPEALRTRVQERRRRGRRRNWVCFVSDGSRGKSAKPRPRPAPASASARWDRAGPIGSGKRIGMPPRKRQEAASGSSASGAAGVSVVVEGEGASRPQRSPGRAVRGRNGGS